MSGFRESEVYLVPTTVLYLCSIHLRLLSVERPCTVLRVSLHHPTKGPAIFPIVPPWLHQLLVGWGPDAHLPLQLPRLSGQQLSLEPYREKGSTLLAFSLKALSLRDCVEVNGLTRRFLE